MKPIVSVLALLAAAAVPAGLTPSARGAPPPPSLQGWACAECHGAGARDVPAVTGEQIAASAHAGLECVDCHRDVRDLPHPDRLAPVACGSCHAGPDSAYSQHGRGFVGKTEDLPGCAGCHGTHDILPAARSASRMHPQRMAETCGVCHSDLDLARKHQILRAEAAATYEASVHGAHRPGEDPAATCIDCHSRAGTGHRILGVGYSESSINHFNIPATCGRCHGAVREDYLAGIHGQLLQRGDAHAPVCTDCHGEHGILHARDPRSNVSPALIAEATCTPCHESARLNDVYGVEPGKLISFVDSYHGLKSQAGDVTVANCASCHGSHRILPSSDPASSIHAANLQATCGQCHAAISAEFAQTPIHNLSGAASSASRLVSRIYIVLIVLVVGGMLAFVLFDYRKSMAEVLRKPQVRRMSGNAVFQHALLAVSFIGLVVTGFALRYSGAWLFRHLFGWDGGFGFRGVAHRICAGVFLFSVAWHAVYLSRPEGRAFWRGILPRRTDVSETWQTVLFLGGKRDRRPRYGRFSFVEKAEYWALVWGTAVMGITGLLLWFDAIALRLFPKSALDLFRVIHLYEAWLAALAILVWHAYATVFKPGVYPGNPAWMTGTMPEAMYDEEHPGDADPPAAPRVGAGEGR